MRARRYEVTGPERGRVVTVDVPGPGVGQVLMAVRVNGVCASDLPTWSGASPSSSVALGHEPAGEVVAAGRGVALSEGTPVTGRVLASFADVAVADAEDLVVVPDGVALDAALGEPLGCVAEALRRAPVALGDRVAVVGCGFMGLCMLQLLACAPHSRLVAFEPRADARAAAARIGAQAHRPPTPDGAAAGWEPFDLVVEATGAPAGLALATALVRPHGTLAILGYHQGDRQVAMQTWNAGAIEVVNAHVRDRALLREATRRGLAMVAAGRVDLAPLITHRFALADVDDAFATLRSRPDGFVKAVVEPGPR